MDGRQVLVELDKRAKFKSIPVVVLTSSNAPEDREIGVSYQVDGYLIKPVNVDQFLELIQQLKRFWHSDLVLPAVN